MSDQSALTSPVSGFSHIQLNVGDVTRSADWYRTVLGMTVFYDAGGIIALQNRAARITVVISPAERLDLAASPIDHLAFAVPDGPSLEAWARHLTEIGIEHPGVVDELGKPSLQLKDPDGNAVELVAPASRG